MRVTAVHTPLVHANDDLNQLIAAALPTLQERCVLVITSKIISTCENRFVPKRTGTRQEKFDLVKQEADYYLDPHSSKYDLMLTIRDNWMFMFAGIDESNADGQYLLWPKDPQASASKVWQFLREHYGLKEVGVIVTDSSSFPLNWGVVGHAIASCGFAPLRSYIGTPDLFGRLMKMEQVNVAQSIATAAVLEMGEGNEQTPLAIVDDLKHIEWQDHVPTEAELHALHIEMEDDAYAPLLQNAHWMQGNHNKDSREKR